MSVSGVECRKIYLAALLTEGNQSAYLRVVRRASRRGEPQRARTRRVRYRRRRPRALLGRNQPPRVIAGQRRGVLRPDAA